MISAPAPPAGGLRRWEKWALVVLALLVLGAGYRYVTTRYSPTGPVVFLHATLTTNTGMVQEDMTVGVVNGRIAFVGVASDPLPSILSRARRIDTLKAWVSAATFDYGAETPLDGIRHVWVGQIYVGAPGDLVISNVGPDRRRGTQDTPRQILGVVFGGRYFSVAELTRGRSAA